MKSGFPYLVIDTEEIDVRTEAGLEQVVQGIVRKVPGAKKLFECSGPDDFSLSSRPPPPED